MAARSGRGLSFPPSLPGFLNVGPGRGAVPAELLAILPPGCRTHPGGPNKGLPRRSPTGPTAGTASGQSNPLSRENSVGGFKGIIEKKGRYYFHSPGADPV